MVAEDGQRALDILTSDRFDVVLTDLKMPGLDGMELISRIRDIYRDIPIIIMTGYPSLESALDAIRNKVDDYIIKPFNINQLFKAVKKAVKERQSVGRPADTGIESGA